MFSKELKNFGVKYKGRFSIFNAYSRENILGSINGRLDEVSLKTLFDSNSNFINTDFFYICGPGNMIKSVSKFLDLFGINDQKIFYELFSAPLETKKEIIVNAEIIKSNVTVSVDGDDFDFELSEDGLTILDAALEAGADVPFSCKGGFCSVCKAKIIEGTASMDINYSLAEDDVEEGYILTCQAHPTSENLVVDYDEM